MRNNRVVIVLAMVFVLLAALVAIQNQQRPPIMLDGSTAYPTEPAVFNDFLPDNITAIRLRSPETGQTFLLAQDTKGVWTAPESTGTLNLTEANNIARTMVLLPFNHTITLKAGEDKSTYGFTPEGILSIEIVLSNGVTHAVAVGFRTTTQDSYYALVDTRSDLYLLDRAPVDYMISRLKSPPVS
jgi:hypothetical protein